MQFLIVALIFLLVLFFYLHIYFHLKTSDDLEIFEIERPSKEKLEEICDLRQPVLFSYIKEDFNNKCNRSNIVDTYGAFDVKIRDVSFEPTDEEELYVPLSFINCLSAIENDKESKYLVENNLEFLEETSLSKDYKSNDLFLRPNLVSTCLYDIIMGSEGLKTPFRHDINYRNYYLVTEGSVKIMLAPPRSSKYMYKVMDYENFEFRSPVNPWNVQNEYKPDFDKVKCLEIDLLPGNILFIPAYWWHSMKFSKDTTLCSFKYRTYMNNIAILPQLSMKFLQNQNVKRVMAPVANQKVILHSTTYNSSIDDTSIDDTSIDDANIDKASIDNCNKAI